MKHGIVITVTGAAATGKSAIAQLVQQVLKTHGIKAIVRDEDKPRDADRLALALDATAKKTAVEIVVSQLPRAGES